MNPKTEAIPRPFLAMRRGFAGRCPACGEGRLFPRFLKVADRCEACGAEMHHHRADDFPPYIVIIVVAHIVGYGIYVTETRFTIDVWVNVLVWTSLGLGLSLGLIQPVKGAVVGLQYALGMHGFSRAPEEAGGGRQGGDRPGAGDHGPSHLHPPRP